MPVYHRYKLRLVGLAQTPKQVSTKYCFVHIVLRPWSQAVLDATAAAAAAAAAADTAADDAADAVEASAAKSMIIDGAHRAYIIL